MAERVGACIRCTKELYCRDGFFEGIVLENKNTLCFQCKANDPLIDILNLLLESEKAGVETLDYLLKAFASDNLKDPFHQVKDDEAWSCRGLIQAIQREGGTIAKKTGDFTDKVKALSTFEEKLHLLNKGQAWVARKIDNALTYGMDNQTKLFLVEMKQKHDQNVEMMNRFLP